MIGACNAVSPTEGARLEPFAVGGSVGSGDQSRYVAYPTPGDGLLGERPMVPGGRQRTWREDKSQRQVEDDSAQGPVVRATRAPSEPSMDEWDGVLAAGHVDISRLVPVVRGWQMSREVEGRASPILVGRLSKSRWLITHPVPCKGTHRWIVGKFVNDEVMSGVQTLLVKSDRRLFS